MNNLYKCFVCCRDLSSVNLKECVSIRKWDKLPGAVGWANYPAEEHWICKKCFDAAAGSDWLPTEEVPAYNPDTLVLTNEERYDIRNNCFTLARNSIIKRTACSMWEADDLINKYRVTGI